MSVGNARTGWGSQSGWYGDDHFIRTNVDAGGIRIDCRQPFHIDPALVEIARLPWEFLYDPDQGPLAMLDAPIVRYLAQQAAPPAFQAALPLKVLVTGASTPPAPDVERELIEVRAALADLEQAGQGRVELPS